MHTLLIGKDNTIITTNAERIIQRSKGANTVQFLVADDYNGKSMKSCVAVMFYKLPISGEWKSKQLVPEEVLWKDKFVDYRFVIDTDLTVEYGDVIVEVKFYEVSLTGEVNFNQYVRKAIDGIIHISMSKDWASGIADPLLDVFDQRIIQIMALQNQQSEMIEEMQYSSAASLGVTDGKLHLIDTEGERKGELVDVVLPRTTDDDGLNDGLIELGEIIHDEDNPDCECGCDHDNFEELDGYVATQPDDESGNFSEL